MTEQPLKTKRSLPEIHQAVCIRCGDCVSSCPEDALSLTSDGVQVSAPANCIYCAVCEMVCPQNAITCTYEIRWQE